MSLIEFLPIYALFSLGPSRSVTGIYGLVCGLLNILLFCEVNLSYYQLFKRFDEFRRISIDNPHKPVRERLGGSRGSLILLMRT